MHVTLEMLRDLLRRGVLMVDPDGDAQRASVGLPADGSDVDHAEDALELATGGTRR